MQQECLQRNTEVDCSVDGIRLPHSASKAVKGHSESLIAISLAPLKVRCAKFLSFVCVYVDYLHEQ